MVFTALFNKKCRSDEKCQKLCNGNGQPDAGDAEENRKDKYHGKLEHQGSQEGDHGRDQSVVQRREEGRTKYIAFRLDKDTGFEWIGEYDISADDLLSGDNRGQKIHAAKEFLQEVLASGSVAQTKVAEEAESRGIKKKTLWNAKKELEIDSVKIGNQWFWMLPE